MNNEKINKIIAYCLMVTMLGTFLVAFGYGIYRAYFVPKISWSNISSEQLEIELAEEMKRKSVSHKQVAKTKE